MWISKTLTDLARTPSDQPWYPVVPRDTPKDPQLTPSDLRWYLLRSWHVDLCFKIVVPRDTPVTPLRPAVVPRDTLVNLILPNFPVTHPWGTCTPGVSRDGSGSEQR